MSWLLRGSKASLAVFAAAFATLPSAAAPTRFEERSAEVSRSQRSLTTTVQPDGGFLWQTVNRWTSHSSNTIHDLYFAYVGQRVSTDLGATVAAMTRNDALGLWEAGAINSTPVDYAFRASISAVDPLPTLPPLSALSFDDGVAFYRIGDLAPGAFADAAIPARSRSSATDSLEPH